MKITINREEKIELLKAVKSGVLDTTKIPRIETEIRGSNPFLELMMSLPDEDDI